MEEYNNVYFLSNNVALVFSNGPGQDQDRKKRIFTWKTKYRIINVIRFLNSHKMINSAFNILYPDSISFDNQSNKDFILYFMSISIDSVICVRNGFSCMTATRF